MKKIFILILFILILSGCTSQEYKEKLLNEKLSKIYSDYSIIDSCSYWNEGGGDELESIVKINEEYILSEIDVHNKKISFYEEKKILSSKQYNKDILIIEMESIYNNNSLIFFLDDSIEKTFAHKYISDFCLNYSENSELKGFYIDIYYVLDFDKDKTKYTEFAISQTANRCDYEFYKRYKENVVIITEFQQYHQWLPTKVHESYKNHYKEYIKEKISEMNL